MIVRPNETGRRYEMDMDGVFIAGRIALDDAASLMARYGEQAGDEAGARAHACRDAGNILRYCHWRQIERVIAALASHEAIGTVH